MLRVGLTGNIAAGKSTVTRVWRARGAAVIDADELARKAVEPGSQGLRAVVERFGADVLTPAGDLDRRAMRDRVFRDDAARRELEAIVHPEVGRLRKRAELRCREAGARVVVHELPLLFEVGLEDDFDWLVLVDSPVPTRIQRLVQTRGLSADEAKRMVEAQLPAEAKRDRADTIIENDGTIAELEAKAEAVWNELEQRAAESA